MEVSGQPHALATLPLRKELMLSIAQERGCFGEEKSPFPLLTTEPHFLHCSATAEKYTTRVVRIGIYIYIYIYIYSITLVHHL
jgi:hypothetical protein